MTNPGAITRSNLDCVNGYFRTSDYPARLRGHRTWIPGTGGCLLYPCGLPLPVMNCPLIEPVPQLFRLTFPGWSCGP